MINDMVQSLQQRNKTKSTMMGKRKFLQSKKKKGRKENHVHSNLSKTTINTVEFSATEKQDKPVEKERKE